MLPLLPNSMQGDIQHIQLSRYVISCLLAHIIIQTHLIKKVPVNKGDKVLLSPICPNDPHAELIRIAALILFDEAPMGN